MAIQKIFFLSLLSFTLIGCSVQKTSYTAAGAGIAAGVGYSYHHDTKDAVIGGLGGAVTGAVVGQVQEHVQNKKYETGYQKGYTDAQLDVALKNWDEKTGQTAQGNNEDHPKLIQVKVPQREQDDVIYDSHYITLEDYR